MTKKQRTVRIRRRLSDTLRTLLVATSVTLSAPGAEVRAQTSSHNLIFAGIELCLILLEDPRRAGEFSADHGIIVLRSEEGEIGVSHALRETQFGIAGSAIPWLVSSSVRSGSTRVFSCEFSLLADGGITSSDIAALARRLGLNHRRDSDRDWFVSESSAGRTEASLISTEPGSCAAADDLGLSAELLESYLAVCGRTTIEFTMASVGAGAE